jgi:hypothetical protein
VPQLLGDDHPDETGRPLMDRRDALKALALTAGAAGLTVTASVNLDETTTATGE